MKLLFQVLLIYSRNIAIYFAELKKVLFRDDLRSREFIVARLLPVSWLRNCTAEVTLKKKKYYGDVKFDIEIMISYNIRIGEEGEGTRNEVWRCKYVSRTMLI